MKMWARQTGFTIVELLIVIVVIAILAAITIVSYNGIQNRSKESSVASSVQGVYKKVISYKTLTGQYPSQIELINNRAPGSAVDNSGPQEARLEGLGVQTAVLNSTSGTSNVRYVVNGDGTCAWIDWWDFANNRATTLSTTPPSRRIDC